MNLWDQPVPMETFVLLMVAISMRGGWRFVLTTNGVQSVTTHGAVQMQQPFASSWDMLTLQVRSTQFFQLLKSYS